MATEMQNFANRRIRPLCEEMRALKVKIDDMETAWFAGLNSDFSTGGDAFDDGRPDEGLTQMTNADITNAVATLTGMINGDTAYKDQIIDKPTVRPLQAE